MPFCRICFIRFLRLVDPVLVPRANFQLNAKIAAHPEGFRKDIETAIDRAIAYFEAQRGNGNVSALPCLTRLHRLGR